jgi:hypothetical protein
MAAIVNKFNKFVISFFKDNGQNIEELWTSAEVQKHVKSLCSTARSVAGRKKDPDAPRRGRSGYLFFCSEHREQVKKSLGDNAKATDVTKELGRLWNALKDSKKPGDKKILAAYEKSAADDKTRYQDEKANYTPPETDDSDEKTPMRRGKRKSPKKGPKRPKSAYLYFCEDRRKQLKSDNPDFKSTEVTSELGRLWNELKADDSRASDLEKYEKQASDDKERYEGEKSDIGDEVKPKLPPKAVAKKQTAAKVAPKKETPKPAPKKGAAKKNSEPVEDVDDLVDEDVAPKSAKVASDKKLNGYQLFCKTRRVELKAQFSSDKPAEITKKLSEEWKTLSKDDQQKWSVA